MPSYDTSVFNATIKAALRQPTIVKTPLQGNADFLGLCKGYVASMHGDPHFSSFDRRTYNCMGNGTFVLAKSPGKLEIQGFFERAGPITATATKGVVIDYPALPSVPRIQINIAPNAVKALPTTYMINDVCSSHIFLDGILQTATRNTHISDDGSYAMILNADGGIDIQFFDTTTTPPKNITAVRVRVTGSPTGTWGCMMNIQACLPLNEPELLQSTTGLLGTPNGNRDDEWTTPTGQVVPIVSTASESYTYCTTHHCVRKESDSLFLHSENGVKPFNEVYSCSSTYPGRA